MNHSAAPSPLSWLALVAETAGVPGAAIARVELSGSSWSGPVRAVVQIVDAWDQVVGAGSWYGEGSDLLRGATLDIGYDLYSSRGLSVVAWIDSDRRAGTARLAHAPESAVRTACDRNVTIRLRLDPVRLAPQKPRETHQTPLGLVPEAA
jgi:hypothetical protein